MTSVRQAEAKQEQDEVARLSLVEMTTLGDTLAYYDGEAVNVFGGIVGEEVEARIVRYRRRRKAHVSALVTRVIKPSPHRVAPPCPYFGPCSGCQWQHVDYRHQLTLKREAVERELRRFDELRDVPVTETVPSSQVFGYRNHARFTVRRQGSLGFNNRITRRFVKVDRCQLMSPQINRTLELLQDRCGETTNISVRVGANTGDYLIQPTLQEADVPLKSGQKHYTERLLGKEFRISSPSFFQVNTPQAELLATTVRQRLELTGNETVVDAYAGVGTFAVLIAPDVRRVIAIEESDAAVKDAEANTAEVENVEYRVGKTEDVLGSLAGPLDAGILDPPRAGCHESVLDGLTRLEARRTVYVSCDPESLARDLQHLARGGHRVRQVEPIDMFPQTHHVECVATLEYKGG